MCPDIAFYSAAGVSTRQGRPVLTEELPVKHWALSAAQYHVLVVDHSKFGKVRPARMGELAQFNAIVSDCRPDEEYVTYAKVQQVKLMY